MYKCLRFFAYDNFVLLSACLAFLLVLVVFLLVVVLTVVDVLEVVVTVHVTVVVTAAVNVVVIVDFYMLLPLLSSMCAGYVLVFVKQTSCIADSRISRTCFKSEERIKISKKSVTFFIKQTSSID